MAQKSTDTLGEHREAGEVIWEVHEGPPPCGRVRAVPSRPCGALVDALASTEACQFTGWNASTASWVSRNTVVERGELGGAPGGNPRQGEVVKVSVLKGERRRITVLFSDIRGFTTIAEVMRPEAVVRLLGEYFERMVEVVMRHQGTIDKFLGDGMMVIFGAPLDDAYQEEHAVAAAIEMQRELSTLSTKWQAEGRPTIRMGIGINSGAAIVGNIGSDQRMEYTAIGDTVNLASRLESASKELNVEIVVSEQTYDAVRPLFRWKSVGEVTVRGRVEPVRAYSVEGSNENAANAQG